ncbi:MAG: HU family DNA-binding protein [Deltaproteobacteria bacterium]|nr:HU family DNA-binding protein [Deltaproteobacteria bacterium]
MTKTELIDEVAQKAGLAKKDASGAVNAVLETIEEALKNGDGIALTGFGTFSVKERAERKGRNPQTGEEITIPAAKSAKFKAGKNLKNI